MKWTGWLFDNLGLKLFALLLAILLYLHVLTDRTVEETVDFPLVLSGLVDSLSLASAPPESVSVRLRATGKQILQLRYLKPPVTIGLADVGPGTFQRTLGPADVPLEGTTGVTVLSVLSPEVLSLEVEARGHRRVRVVASLSGDPQRGFTTGDPLVRPSLVRLTGPAGWLAGQESLLTLPIAVSGRRETLEVMQAIAGLPPFAAVFPGSVLVAVPIEPEESRTLQVPIEVRGVRGELRAEPQPATGTVTWRGPRSRAAQLDADAFRASVDAGGRGRGEWKLPLEWSGPGLRDGVGVPDSVRVTLH